MGNQQSGAGGGAGKVTLGCIVVYIGEGRLKITPHKLGDGVKFVCWLIFVCSCILFREKVRFGALDCSSLVVLCLNNGAFTPPSPLSCSHESTQEKGEKKEKKKYEPPVPTRYIDLSYCLELG